MDSSMRNFRRYRSNPLLPGDEAFIHQHSQQSDGETAAKIMGCTIGDIELSEIQNFTNTDNSTVLGIGNPQESGESVKALTLPRLKFEDILLPAINCQDSEVETSSQSFPACTSGQTDSEKITSSCSDQNTIFKIFKDVELFYLNKDLMNLESHFERSMSQNDLGEMRLEQDEANESLYGSPEGNKVEEGTVTNDNDRENKTEDIPDCEVDEIIVATIQNLEKQVRSHLREMKTNFLQLESTLETIFDSTKSSLEKNVKKANLYAFMSVEHIIELECDKSKILKEVSVPSDMYCCIILGLIEVLEISGPIKLQEIVEDAKEIVKRALFDDVSKCLANSTRKFLENSNKAIKSCRYEMRNGYKKTRMYLEDAVSSNWNIESSEKQHRVNLVKEKMEVALTRIESYLKVSLYSMYGILGKCMKAIQVEPIECCRIYEMSVVKNLEELENFAIVASVDRISRTRKIVDEPKKTISQRIYEFLSGRVEEDSSMSSSENLKLNVSRVATDCASKISNCAGFLRHSMVDGVKPCVSKIRASIQQAFSEMKHDIDEEITNAEMIIGTIFEEIKTSWQN